MVMIIATERFFAICHTLRHRVLNGKTRAMKSVITTWIVSFALAIFRIQPSVTKQTCYVLSDEIYQKRLIISSECISSCRYCSDTVYGIDFVQFFAAFFLTSFMYIQVVIEVTKRDVGRTNTNNKIKTRNAVIRMVIINSIIFFLCSFPYQIINLDSLNKAFVGSYLLTTNQFHLIAWFGRVASLINSAVNPMVYSLTNSSYRRAFFSAMNFKYNRNTSKRSESRLKTVSYVHHPTLDPDTGSDKVENRSLYL